MYAFKIMRIIKILFFAISIISIVSCNSRQTGQSSVEVIDFVDALDNVEEVMLSDYFSSIKYTPIETRDSVLIKFISTTFETDGDVMFIPSGNFQETVYIFDKEGKYIRNIGRKGRGPGEYLAVKTIKYLPDSDIVMIVGGTKATFYSYSDGVCINQLDVADFFDRSKDVVQHHRGMSSLMQNINARSFILHQDHLYVIAADNTTFEQFLLIFNSNMALSSKLDLGKTSLQLGIPLVSVGSLYLFNGKVNVVSGLYDTIYTYEDNRLVPHIAFDYGGYNSTHSTPLRNRNAFFSKKTQALMSEMFQASSSYFESDNYFIGTVYIPSSVAKYNGMTSKSNFVYDKHTKQSRILRYSNEVGYGGFINDIDKGMPFWPDKQIEKNLYQFVDAGTFIEMSRKFNSPEMKKVAASLTEESNPVMVTVTLK